MRWSLDRLRIDGVCSCAELWSNLVLPLIAAVRRVSSEVSARPETNSRRSTSISIQDSTTTSSSTVASSTPSNSSSAAAPKTLASDDIPKSAALAPNNAADTASLNLAVLKRSVPRTTRHRSPFNGSASATTGSSIIPADHANSAHKRSVVPGDSGLEEGEIPSKRTQNDEQSTSSTSRPTDHAAPAPSPSQGNQERRVSRSGDNPLEYSARHEDDSRHVTMYRSQRYREDQDRKSQEPRALDRDRRRDRRPNTQEPSAQDEVRRDAMRERKHPGPEGFRDRERESSREPRHRSSVERERQVSNNSQVSLLDRLYPSEGKTEPKTKGKPKLTARHEFIVNNCLPGPLEVPPGKPLNWRSTAIPCSHALGLWVLATDAMCLSGLSTLLNIHSYRQDLCFLYRG